MDHPDNDTMVVAQRLIDKLRAFVFSLDEAERPLLAALLAPGIAAAWATPPDSALPDGTDPGGDRSGFELGWTPQRLPAHLGQAVRQAEMRITFAGPR